MKGKLLLPILLMIAFALTRWPGIVPFNFSAAYAIAFCAGVYFPKKLAWWVPMATLLATDVVLNVFYYDVGPLHSSMIPNYISFLAIIFLGRRFSSKSSWLALLGGGILGAILFYLVTNTAAWMQLDYPKTLLGWIQALTTGLPGFPPTWEFFRNTLMSGGLFTGLFAAVMKADEAAEEAEEKAEEEEAEPAGEPEESGA